MTKNLVATVVVLVFTVTPSYGEHLMRGSTWDKLGYSQNDKEVDKDGNPKSRAGSPSEEGQLSTWFDAFKDNIIANSTATERDLKRKSVSCSFKLTYKGQFSDLQIERSSGFPEIDQQFLDVISRADPKRISPPPNRAPFYRGMLVSFTGTSFAISLKPWKQDTIKTSTNN